MNVFSNLIVCTGLAFYGGTVLAQNVHGVLRVVKGDVQVKSSKGETTKARIGGKVFPKDVVITGKDARAKIVMIDNNEINVSPESQVEIQHYDYDPAAGKKDVLLNVIYGKVRSKVEQKYDGKTSKFQIKTPSAVAGVRGTDFMMGFNKGNGSSQVVTFEGKVEFGVHGPGGSIGSPVYVTPGMSAAVSAAGAAPSPPIPMPKEELAKVDTESNAEPPKGQSTPPRAPADTNKGENKDGAKNEGSSGTSGGGPQAKENASPSGSLTEAKRDIASAPSSCEMCGTVGGGGGLLPPPVPSIPKMPVFNDPRGPVAPPKFECGLECQGFKTGPTNLIIKVK